ncbi:RNA degradosome polyphosphate kinase [Lacticaseibacillus rhamnosus]|uniref:RNA degradosome polyphosphate kinase n=1 Tax=Lacticaseibacillus rhamnosus TaxID=47715 RepID=UPI0021A6D82B|nr:RNA degradosome polyphosphate kinase [Lacticaseibacillus rhamnosus]MCT3152443.1 RNA degradosome polyphosphate kinase [Lacticaseibacillus rhamnosus]
MKKLDFSKPRYFNNRELSWLAFNDRVLEEARDKNNPLLERVRFLGITQSNLDEFFNIRVASLKKMVTVNYDKPDAAGMKPQEQLDAISKTAHEMVEKQYNTLVRSLIPKLNAVDIQLLHAKDLTQKQQDFVSDYFHYELYPVLTPMGVDPTRPFPFLSNNSLNLAIRLVRPDDDDDKSRSFAMVQVPDVFPRVLRLPGGDNVFILLEEVIRMFVGELFVGADIKETSTFRVTRDMDMDVAEEDASDLMKEIQSQLKKRQRGKVMRLEIEAGMGKHLRKRLTKAMNVKEEDIYEIHGPIDLNFLSKLVKQVHGHKELLFKPFTPYIDPAFKDTSIFDVIKERDVFMQHPYDSFEPVVDFIREAAQDPQVLAVKMTLYRVSSKSPIIRYLKKAAENGKQVTVLVELKARFDEENNVHWAQELEHAGCHVIYGLVGLKTHCKLALVVRREEDGIKRYMHMATGNYNDVTARLYTDMGLFTCNNEIGEDASNIFNMLSGFSEPPYFHKLVIAPLGIRDYLMDRVDEEIAAAKAGRKALIQMKMNSMSDTAMIEKLYEASHAGVEIHLLIRGICNLKVGIPGVSDNITVHSIVGQLLEHSRIYYFYADGQENVYLSSVDLMNRNLSRRVELLFPILQDDIRERIIKIFDIMWHDNVKTRILQPDSTWTRAQLRGVTKLNAQAYFIEHAVAMGEALRREEIDQAPEDLHATHTFIPMTAPKEDDDA